MQPNSNNSQFVFVLPTDFVPPELEYKYRIHLQNYRLPYESVVDYLSSTIKEIDLPSLTFPTVQQETRYGKKISYRGSISPYDVYSNKTTITFRSVNNHMNYFIMRDCLQYHYIKADVLFVSPFIVDILDFYFRENMRYMFKEIVPTGLSEIKLGYQDQDNDEKIFSMPVIYNFVEVQYLLRDTPQLPTHKKL